MQWIGTTLLSAPVATLRKRSKCSQFPAAMLSRLALMNFSQAVGQLFSSMSTMEVRAMFRRWPIVRISAPAPVSPQHMSTRLWSVGATFALWLSDSTPAESRAFPMQAVPTEPNGQRIPRHLPRSSFFAEQAAPITGRAGPHAQEWLRDPRHRAPASYESRGPRDRKTAVQDRLRSVQQVRCFPSDCGASLKASVSFGEDVAMLPGQSFGGREVQSGPRTRHRAIAVYMFMRRHRLRAG